MLQQKEHGQEKQQQDPADGHASTGRTQQCIIDSTNATYDLTCLKQAYLTGAKAASSHACKPTEAINILAWGLERRMLLDFF